MFILDTLYTTERLFLRAVFRIFDNKHNFYIFFISKETYMNIKHKIRKSTQTGDWQKEENALSENIHEKLTPLAEYSNS